MKSRRHKNNSAPFSLFSFQDIITGISGIMIFVLLILSLELTIPEEEKSSTEESRKTLFAQNQMEVFVAGKLEIANSHTAMSQEEIMNLYLEDGSQYFQSDNGMINSATVTGALYANPAYGLNTTSSDSSLSSGQQANGGTGSTNSGNGSAGSGNGSSGAPLGPGPQMPQGKPDPLRNAFKWLAGTQKANGSWDNQLQHAKTALVVMSYLSFRKNSGSPEFDETVKNGIKFLIEDEKCTPEAEQFAYQNGIKTFALTEAVRVFGTDSDIEEAIQESVKYIVENQDKTGGFKDSNNNSDEIKALEIAAWNLMALNAAGRLYSIDEARTGMNKAKKWLNNLSKQKFTAKNTNKAQSSDSSDNSDDSEASNDSEDSIDTKEETMRAIVSWLTIFLNNDKLKNVEDDLKVITNESIENLKWDTESDYPLLGWYFATKCMLAVGDEYKDEENDEDEEVDENWTEKLRELLLANQMRTGYWSPLKSIDYTEQIYMAAYSSHMLALVYDYSKANVGPPLPRRNMAAASGNQSDSSNSSQSQGQATGADGSSQQSQGQATGTGSMSQNATGVAEPTLTESPQVERKQSVTNENSASEEFDNLISLNKHKAQEIKKRLNVFRRSLKSNSEVRRNLESIDIGDQNKAIVQSLNQKYFLEAQLNKMSKDPYIHDKEILRDRYIELNKKVAKLMKEIHLYEKDNSNELTLNPIRIFIASKELDIHLNNGQNLRFSSSPDGLKDFQTWLKSKDPLTDVLMVNIKPSGVGLYRKIEDYIELLNFKNLTTPVDENMGGKL